MKEISEIKEKFQQKRPVDWDMIPDIPLTKNQVVMYMPRQLVGMDGEDDITAAMINTNKDVFFFIFSSPSVFILLLYHTFYF